AKATQLRICPDNRADLVKQVCYYPTLIKNPGYVFQPRPALGVQPHVWEGRYALDDICHPFHHVAAWNGDVIHAGRLPSHIAAIGVSCLCGPVDYRTAAVVT